MSKIPQHTITIEVFKPSTGGTCVFPPLARVKEQVRLLAEVEDRAAKAGDKSTYRASEVYLAGHEAARALATGAIEVRTFSFTPFTHGQKLEAKRQATIVTVVDGNERFRFDQDKYEVLIVAASTGLTEDAVLALEPPVFDYLVEEVFGRNAIQPERLSFFGT